MILVWVRHGQTKANAEQRYQGVSDYPLTPLGKRQAEALAERFTGVPFRAIYSSPLRRAWDTARIIAERHGLEVRKESALQEMDFGLWEGQTLGQVRERDRERLEQWWERPDQQSPPGGETLHQVLLRVRPFVERLQREWDEEDWVLAVSHVVPIKVAVLDALQVDLRRHWQFRLDVASVTTIAYHRRGAILMGFNDTWHWTAVHRGSQSKVG